VAVRNEIGQILDSFSAVTLEEMDKVRLMNRFDTKFIFSLQMLPEILNRMNAYYKTLSVNNIRTFSYNTTYLDTGDFLFFHDHVTGRLERNKIRFREYDSTGKTFLEVKKRTNKHRTIKWRIERNTTSQSNCDEEAFEFIMKHVNMDCNRLRPVLNNSFRRITMVSREINERITIDYDLSFSLPEGNEVSLPFLAVIELKRELLSQRSDLAFILKEFFIYPTSFSKYCIGTSILNDIPHKNILKPKFLQINKIQTEYDRLFNS
jgi:hypothetical protein